MLPSSQPSALERVLSASTSAERIEEAAEALLRGYGPEIYGFLVATLGEADAADEAFSIFAEGLWTSLPSFRRESSFRTWAYAVARHAAWRVRRGERRRRRVQVGLSEAGSSAERIAVEVKSSTALYRRTDTKDRVRRLRERLDPEEREILVLRVDRGLEWLDVARVLEEPGATDDEGARARRAAALRKRFERIKQKLRALAEEEGLLQPRPSA